MSVRPRLLGPPPDQGGPTRSMHGTVDSPDPEELTRLIPEIRRRAAEVPIQPSVEGDMAAPASPSSASRLRNLIAPPAPAVEVGAAIGPGASSRELAVFFRSLSVMLASGVPLAHSLELLAVGTDLALAESLLQASSLLRQGSRLSEALGRRPNVFKPVMVTLIEAGENSGRLDLMLSRLADFQERRAKLEMMVKSALTYPLIVFGISLAILVILPLFLADGLFAMMREMHGQLPLATRVLMAISDLARNPLAWMGGVATAVALGAWWRKAMADEAWRLERDRRLLRLPAIGPLLQKVCTALFAVTLETTYAAGIPVLRALDMAARSTGNAAFEKSLQDIIPAVEHGVPLHRALRGIGLLPRLAIDFVKVGEESGTLPTMLSQIGRLAEEEVEHRLQGLVAALEPIMLWVMGCVVGLVCLAILQPFLSMVESLAL